MYFLLRLKVVFWGNYFNPREQTLVVENIVLIINLLTLFLATSISYETWRHWVKEYASIK